MAKHKIEVDEKCKSCKGTGLYTGMAERDGAAVVCHTCKGTGKYHFRYEYEDFEGRVDRDDILHVFEVNPGICIGTGSGHSFGDFGGMSYKDWKAGKPFLDGTENRKYTCPYWWYQSADYKKKPQWSECMDALGRSFSHCPHFGTKNKCWGRFDSEQKTR